MDFGGGVDFWAKRRAHEWANGRAYREVRFALPRELGEPEQRILSSRFAGHPTGGERLPHPLAIHRGGRSVDFRLPIEGNKKGGKENMTVPR